MNARNLAIETNTSELTKQKLISDFKVVVADAEALLKATAGQSGEALAAMRAKVDESLASAKAKMIEAEAALTVKTKAAAVATDEYVHENPWQAVGVAAGIGVLIGLLISRR